MVIAAPGSVDRGASFRTLAALSLTFIAFFLKEYYLKGLALAFSCFLFIIGMRIIEINLSCLIKMLLFSIFVILLGIVNSWISGEYNILGILFWSQLFVFLFLPLFVGAEQALRSAGLCLLLLFFLDLWFNIYYWTMASDSYDARPGEIIPRYGGVTGSSLFSGMLTLLAFVFVGSFRRLNYILTLLFLLNLLLSGSSRYFLCLFYVLPFIFFPSLLSRKKIVISYSLVSLAILVLAVWWSSDFIDSNKMRLDLWLYAIQNVDWITGRGFYYPDTVSLLGHSMGDEKLLNELKSLGVTESLVLLFAVCFGWVPLFLLFFGIWRLYLCGINTRLGHGMLIVFGVFLADSVMGGSLANPFFLLLFSIIICALVRERCCGE